jgi:hypothetical protein
MRNKREYLIIFLKHGIIGIIEGTGAKNNLWRCKDENFRRASCVLGCGSACTLFPDFSI